jgi:succinoglycan biosynthesis protein ExoU
LRLIADSGRRLDPQERVVRPRFYIRLTEPAINDVSRVDDANTSHDQARGQRAEWGNQRCGGCVTSGKASVCVIIPAWNAASTIARAVRSALGQPEAVEVIVVDDCSTDATASVATTCDDGSGRLQILRQPHNQGPAAARNLAISRSRSDFIALLDADDFLLPARFAPLLAIGGWDMITDNIVFVRDDGVGAFDASQIAQFDTVPEQIELEAFIDGNISRPGHPRAEMGFAKPVMRRAFIEKHQLGYDESLRLGEDYALYVQMMALGAVFLRVRRCGYVAVERVDSLSGRHSAADLAALLAFDRAFAQTATLTPGARAALDRLIRHLTIKLGYRAFLDKKRASGLVPAVAEALSDVESLPGIAASLLRDKLPTARRTSPAASREPRYLFA